VRIGKHAMAGRRRMVHLLMWCLREDKLMCSVVCAMQQSGERVSRREQGPKTQAVALTEKGMILPVPYGLHGVALVATLACRKR
jgi:hypothetical protein